MKKTSLRFGAMLLCLIMCLSFAGCSADLGEVLLIKKAYDAILTVNSFRFTAEAEAVGAYGTEPVKLSAEAEGECIVDPLTASMELKLDIGEQGTLSVPLCLVSADGKPELYAGLGIGGATIWVSLDPGATEGALSGGVQEMLAYMKDYADPISRGEKKKINGVTATALTLRIPGELLALRDENGQVIKGEQTMEELSLTVWLEEENCLPVRIEADLQPLAAYYLSVSEETAAMPLTVESLPLTIDISDFNAVDAIELPSGLADVRAASGSDPAATAEPSPAPSAAPSAEPSPAPSIKPTTEPSPKV